MNLKEKIIRFLNRSIFSYVLVLVVISCLVDWNVSKQQREKYLLGIFANGGFKNYYDGILYFDSMINHFPNRADCYEGLGVCYFNLKQYDQALWAYQKAFSFKPDDEDIKYNLRVIEQKLNKTKE